MRLHSILVQCCCIAMLSVAMMGRSQVYESLPYEFGFEDHEGAEMAKWQLNPDWGTLGADSLIDKWCVGDVLHSSGSKGLYMSNSEGLTSDCGKRYLFVNEATGMIEYILGNPRYVQFAYRDFALPTGKYYVSFDYICPNMQLAAGYVTFIQPPTAQSNKVTLQRGTDVLPNVNPVIGPQTGVKTWSTANFNLNITQPSNGDVRYVRLWFAWINSEPDSIQHGISGAIDNIQIVENLYPIPTDFVGLVEDCDHITFEWSPVASKYQFQYRRTGETTWKNRWANGHVYTLQGMKEGRYDFRVRSVNIQTSAQGRVDTTYSPYAYISNFDVFCPELHCINYSVLHDSTLARCTYGTTTIDGYEANKDKAFDKKGVIDMGPNSILSRHTVIWDTLALDPRTQNRLRMVPQGETSSVRLGNWDSGNGTEAITYPYLVDKNNAILLLRYAIVLENPTGHSEDEMPRFILEVRDEDGQLVDATCGRVDLNPLSKDGGWKELKSTGAGQANIVYKDWTTLGLNLSDYEGQMLQISVITYDCFQSAHYGYAYFTMDCESANIKNTGCGKEVMTVVAPDGFKYEWRAENDPAVRSTDRSMDIRSTDPTNWTCRLTSKENAGCSFELSINTTARWPQAGFEIEYAPQHCENRYKIKNTSYVWVNEGGKRIEYLDESCENYEWEFSTGQADYTTSPQPGYILFPSEGGKHWVRLTARNGIGEGACLSDSVIEVDVPRIGDTMERIDSTICEGSWVDWHGDRYTTSGEYKFQGEDPITGCFANDTLYLTVRPQNLIDLPDTTVCYGDTVRLDTLWSDISTTLRLVLHNQYGCDSTIVRKVTVLPELMPIVDFQEADSTHQYGYIHVTITDFSNVSYFTINDTVYTESVVLDSLRGGIFQLTFYNDFGCSISQDVRMCRYQIFQRWDDVISLMNENYAGGGVFSAYQWYENDLPIAGANRSYYYKEGGFSPDDYYTCQVTLPDGSQEMSCIFVPTIDDSSNVARVSPTYLKGRRTIDVIVSEPANVCCYNTMGQRIFSTSVEKGVSAIEMTVEKGIYILIISLPDGDKPFRISVE